VPPLCIALVAVVVGAIEVGADVVGAVVFGADVVGGLVVGAWVDGAASEQARRVSSTASNATVKMIPFFIGILPP
jgi:uncharacterized membrane protein